MNTCINCNAPLHPNARYCNICGYPVSEETALKDEQEFLNTTYRLLRWEKKAWNICGTVMLVIGAFYAALFTLIGMIGLFSEELFAAGFSIIFLFYGLLFGGLFLAIGIIGKISAKKIPPYLDVMHINFEMTVLRSGNVGMLVFSALFGEPAFIFFLINFIRLKSNPQLVQRIINRQKNHG